MILRTFVLEKEILKGFSKLICELRSFLLTKLEEGFEDSEF